MNALCLPDHLTPLLMHIEPLLAAADKYQLGEAGQYGVERIGGGRHSP